MSNAAAPRLFIIAGEPSGDALGGPLIDHLRERFPDLRLHGVGGTAMQEAGLESLFPMEELSVMGIAEVLPKIPQLLRRIGETARKIEEIRPDVIVTIDSPDFTLRVAKKVRRLGIPIVHYVAPTVWAWRPGRAAKLAKIVDHVMALFPFEPEYFEAVGLKATFVGHPVVERQLPETDSATYRSSLGLEKDRRIISVLPGSRRGEIDRLMPVFGDALLRLLNTNEDKRLSVIIPTLPHLQSQVIESSNDWPCHVVTEPNRDRFFDALRISEAALCASGTVVLELARAGAPTIVAYRINRLTAMIARRLIKLKFVSLVNIIAGREIMPEFLQENCTAKNLSRALEKLLDDPAEQEKQRSAFGETMRALGQGDAPPSERAAFIVAAYLGAD